MVSTQNFQLPFKMALMITKMECIVSAKVKTHIPITSVNSKQTQHFSVTKPLKKAMKRKKSRGTSMKLNQAHTAMKKWKAGKRES